MIQLKLETKKVLSYQNNLKHSKYGHYFTKNYKEFRLDLANQVKKQMVNQYCFANTPLKASLCFSFPLPAKYKVNEKEAVKGCLNDNVRHDLDNLNKSIFDVLQESGSIDDDNNVVIIHEQKVYNEDIKDKNTYIYIRLEKADKLELFF